MLSAAMADASLALARARTRENAAIVISTPATTMAIMSSTRVKPFLRLLPQGTATLGRIEAAFRRHRFRVNRFSQFENWYVPSHPGTDRVPWP